MSRLEWTAHHIGTYIHERRTHSFTWLSPRRTARKGETQENGT